MFSKNGHVQQIQKCKLPGGDRRPNVGNTAGSFEVWGSNFGFHCRFEMENDAKHILDSSATIPAQFSYIKRLFERRIPKNHQQSRKSMNIYHFYRLGQAYWYIS